MNKPFEIKIKRSDKKGSLFSNFELIIDGTEFTFIRNQGVSKTILNE